jgi:hypothetical protein
MFGISNFTFPSAHSAHLAFSVLRNSPAAHDACWPSGVISHQVPELWAKGAGTLSSSLDTGLCPLVMLLTSSSIVSAT